MSMSIRKPKTPMCDSDIDSSHQEPSNKVTNSTKTRNSSGQMRLLILMTTSFAIYVLTLQLVTNTETNNKYLKFTPKQLLRNPHVR